MRRRKFQLGGETEWPPAMVACSDRARTIHLIFLGSSRFSHHGKTRNSILDAQRIMIREIVSFFLIIYTNSI